jgi:hypothetical protein
VTRVLFCLVVILGAGLLAAAFFSLGFPVPGYSILGLGLAWMAGLFLGWKWISVPALFAYFGFAAAGFYLMPSAGLASQASTWLLVAGALCALSAGDLSDFLSRLDLAADEDDVPALERRHYLQLSIVVTIGAILSVSALAVHVRVSFEWSLGLIVLGVWGISRVVGWLLKKGDG